MLRLDVVNYTFPDLAKDLDIRFEETLCGPKKHTSSTALLPLSIVLERLSYSLALTAPQLGAGVPTPYQGDAVSN